MVDYRMFPLKRSEDQDVMTEVASRPSQTQVESEVEQVICADDHSDTATNAADCGPDTDEGLEAFEPLRPEMERPLTGTKQEMRRDEHGLGMEIREMLQEMGRQMWDMRHDIGYEMRVMKKGVSDMGCEMQEMQHGMSDMGCEMREMQQGMSDMGCEMREMQQGMSDMERKTGEMVQEMLRETRRDTGALQLEIRQEMCEMQKEMKREMSVMQQKMHDMSKTASHADVINLATAASDSGRSNEEDLQGVTVDITDAGNTLFLNILF